MPKSKAQKRSARPARPTERVRDPHFFRCYANTATIEMTPMDLRIRFGEIEEVSDEKLVIREVAFVSMSPQHASALVDTLRSTLDRYNQQIEEARRRS